MFYFAEVVHRKTLEAVHQTGLHHRPTRDDLNHESQPSLLSALMALSEGDSLAYKQESSKARGYSEVTLSLLNALVQRLPQMELVSGSREAPRSIISFMEVYWDLAYRSKLVSVNADPSSTHTIDDIHSRQMAVFSTLCSFFESRLPDEEFT